MEERLARLDPDALTGAADASMGIDVTATGPQWGCRSRKALACCSPNLSLGTLRP
jgi:hypothetical protein